MTSWVFMWEDHEGERHWEAVKESQINGFLEKLLTDGVNPATVMTAYNPIFFHWVFKKYHKGLSDVFFGKINKEIYGAEPTEEGKHKPVEVPEHKKPEPSKFGWLSPDGRFFSCEYGGHSHLADKIVGEIKHVSNPERHLEDLGWAKILSGKVNRERYAVCMGLDKKLTDAQFRMLQHLKLDNAYGIKFLL